MSSQIQQILPGPPRQDESAGRPALPYRTSAIGRASGPGQTERTGPGHLLKRPALAYPGWIWPRTVSRSQ